MEGETEYAFWHALVRDVAYGALPRAARVAKHRAAAAWIAARSGGVNGRTAEIVAEHYLRALDLVRHSGPAPMNSTRSASRSSMRSSAPRPRDGNVPVAGGDACSPGARSGRSRRSPPRRSPDDARARHLMAANYPVARQSLEDVLSLLLSKGGAPAAASLAAPLSSALLETGDAPRATTILDEARGALADQPGPTMLEVMAEQAMMFVRAGKTRARRRSAGRSSICPRRWASCRHHGPSWSLVDAIYVCAIEIADATGNLRLSSRCRYNFALPFRGPATAGSTSSTTPSTSTGPMGSRTSARTTAAHSPRSTTSSLGRVIDDLETLIAKARETGDVFTSVRPARCS